MAASIMSRLASVSAAAAPAPQLCAAAGSAAAAAPLLCRQSSYAYDDADDDYNGWNYDDANETIFDNSGTVTMQPRLDTIFESFGFKTTDVLSMMRDTSACIGGGLMVNQVLAMNGMDRPFCSKGDIDFYVSGGIPPIYSPAIHGGKCLGEYNTQRVHAAAFRALVVRRFANLILPAGYSICLADQVGAESYVIEKSDAGDRIFTTGSSIRMCVQTYVANINGVEKSLNLVFCDTSLYELITKVDINLTAGFFCADSYYDRFVYHHAAPEAITGRHLDWMQPESTHTERQKARMAKYRTRYNLVETIKMPVADFIRDFDTLPDNTKLNIVLIGTEDEIHSKPVTRRILGLPTITFSVEIHTSSIIGDVVTHSPYPTAAERAQYALDAALQKETIGAIMRLACGGAGAAAPALDGGA
jgi:hypothetical protein